MLNEDQAKPFTAEDVRFTRKGDTLYATELPDGIKLSPFDVKLAAQMETAERIMRKDRNVLRKLAKS